MPAAAVASLTPAIAGISGTSVGARGETAVDMRAPSSTGSNNRHARIYTGLPRPQGRSTASRRRMAGHFGPAMTTVNTIGLEEVTANFYFFAGAILESFAASGLAVFGLGASGVCAVSAGLFLGAILAVSGSFFPVSACALSVTKVSDLPLTWPQSGGLRLRLSPTLM